MSAVQTFIVIGAGQAGAWAARTLREEGFEGRILLLSEESHLPYERPPLSKALLLGEADVASTYFWPIEIYDELRIELRLDTRVALLVANENRIELAGGGSLTYDRLLLATGGRPRPLLLPGADLDGVCDLRSITDTLAICEALETRVAPGGNVLIVGGGWIGLEVAAAVQKLGAQAIVVETLDRLCARVLSPELSAWILNLHTSHGVDVRLGCGIEGFQGDDILKGAALADGSTVDAALAVVGIGIIPNAELAADAGLEIENGIKVDEFGCTSDADIFAAGDVASHPNAVLGQRVRLESWENAQNQGIATAKSMLGRQEPYGDVPWFWSDQYDVNLQLIGLPEDWDETVIRGDQASGSFIHIFRKAGLVIGAVAVNNGRDLRDVKRMMQMGKIVDADALADPAQKLHQLLKG